MKVGPAYNYNPFVNSIDTNINVTDGFKYGFNSKCLFSHAIFYYGLSDYIEFDSSVALPLLSFNVSATNPRFNAFCMI